MALIGLEATGIRSNSGLASGHAADPVEASVEGEDLAHAGDLGLGDQVGLGEVEAVGLMDLQRSQQRGRIDGDDRGEGDRGAHQLGGAGGLQPVHGLEHVDAFGEHQVGQQQPLAASQGRGGARGQVRWIAGEVADQDVGIQEGGQARRPTRARLAWPMISSQGVPRLPAGTGTEPARSRKSGVFATTARERSTLNSTSSPSFSSSASRTAFGIVI